VLALKSDTLQVCVLDPAADRACFGTRYCTGGYIFQVLDLHHGEVLSGPTYPDSFNWFDGQGIPDAFNLSPLRDPASTEAEALVIGVGRCDLQANQVREFCVWEVERQPEALTMRTRQEHSPFALELERTVALHQRTVRSATRIRNTGKRLIPVCWFPHPFFPQPETDELCRFNAPVSMPDNPGFILAPSGFIQRLGWPWSDGHYQPLDHRAQAPLVVTQRHPQLGLVAAHCSYVPSYFPIWGNTRTFSWEPFLERLLAPDQELSWSIDYDF
jgi:hypothetical protein